MKAIRHPRWRMIALVLLAIVVGPFDGPAVSAPSDAIPPFGALLARPVRLKPELASVHPRVFVTAAGLDELRARARTTHREEWQRVLASLPALAGEPPPPPGPQARRSQNNVAHAVAGVSLAWAVERRPDLLAAAKKWTLAAAAYEPWGYSYNKPNVDLAAGHLLYAIGWAYDLLYHELSAEERATIRTSLERHAALVNDHFTPGPKRQRFEFTQNHNFIPTAGLGIAALALMGESKEAERWAATAYAHHHRANQLLSPDGYYYEGIEYWIFSAPWLVHFADAWLHATGESLFELGPYRKWKTYVAHVLAPNGQDAFDFGDAWEGSLTRERRGEESARVYPGGTLQSNANLLYGVAARLRDPETQAIAERCRGFGHTSLEEHWTLLWRDPELAAAPISQLPLHHVFVDSGVGVLPHVLGEGRARVRLQGGPARRTPLGAAARLRPGVAPEHGALASRRGELHRVVGRAPDRGRHRLRRPADGEAPQHRRGGRLRPGPRAGARRVGRHGPRGPRRDPPRGGRARADVRADRGRARGRLPARREGLPLPSRALVRGSRELPRA